MANVNLYCGFFCQGLLGPKGIKGEPLYNAVLPGLPVSFPTLQRFRLLQGGLYPCENLFLVVLVELLFNKCLLKSHLNSSYLMSLMLCCREIVEETETLVSLYVLLSNKFVYANK